MNVLIIVPGFIPSTIIGVIRPLAALARMGEICLRVRIHKTSFLLAHDIRWCDTAVFCRNCEMSDLRTLYALKKEGKNVIYEIDDNFAEIPLSTSVGIYHRVFSRLHVLRRFFLLADVTRVYSNTLSALAISYGARVQLIRSYFDSSIIDNLQKTESDGKIKLVYPTGRIDDQALEEHIFTAVREILNRYAGRVEFHLWRPVVPKQLDGVHGVVLRKPTRNYEKFIRDFFRANFDIGLAPGVDTPFFHSKTNNKYREFGGCGIAGIYSNTPPYSNSVIHEQTGLLAGPTTSDWIAAMERLILERSLRQRIVAMALNDVRENYSFTTAVDSWRTCLGGLIDHTFDTPTWLPERKKFPLFSVTTFGLKNGIGGDLDSLKLSLKHLAGSLLLEFSDGSDLLLSGMQAVCAAHIFIISSKEHVREVEELLSLLPTSAIIDASRLSEDLEDTIRLLRHANPTLPISFLISSSQAKKFDFVKGEFFHAVSASDDKSTVLQNFSLSGFPAAYLDLLERHLQYAPLRAPGTGVARLINSSIPLGKLYIRWLNRFETLLILLSYRISIFRR